VHYGASEARNVKAQFFMLGWARCSLHKKHTRTRYTELLFFHPVGSMGHVVHFGAAGAENVDVLLFMLRCARAVSKKSVPGHVTLNFCFCNQRDLWVT
jgi:hypothetical protein